MKYSTHIFLCFLAIALCHCKRKTNISLTAYNYALAEPIAGAKVVIIERKSGGGIFSPIFSCKEIAQATTDANGECVFDKTRLKTRESYDYFAVVNYAYGKAQGYPCGGKTSGFFNVGKTNSQVLNYSNFECYLRIQYNNKLNPAQTGDSLYLYISSPKYTVPEQPYPFGGGGVFINWNYYGDPGYPYNSLIQTNIVKTNAGKHVLYVYKKKLGVVTQTWDTIKIHPYTTKIIEINW